MLIVELTYKKSLSEVEKHLETHKQFLQQYYEDGTFIASGPKNPRDGGVILANASKDEMEAIIRKDPFFTKDIADYRIVDFKPNRFSPEFEKVCTALK